MLPLHICLPFKEQGYKALYVTHFIHNLRTTFRHLRSKLHHMGPIQRQLLQNIFLELGYLLPEFDNLRFALLVFFGQISGMGKDSTRKDSLANLRGPQPSFG